MASLFHSPLLPASPAPMLPPPLSSPPASPKSPPAPSPWASAGTLLYSHSDLCVFQLYIYLHWDLNSNSSVPTLLWNSYYNTLVYFVLLRLKFEYSEALRRWFCNIVKLIQDEEQMISEIFWATKHISTLGFIIFAGIWRQRVKPIIIWENWRGSKKKLWLYQIQVRNIYFLKKFARIMFRSWVYFFLSWHSFFLKIFLFIYWVNSEAAEVAEILAQYGIEPHEYAPVVSALRKKPQAWLDFMMK